MLPMNIMSYSDISNSSWYNCDRIVLDSVSPAGAVMTFFFAVLIAMAVYSYQFNDGSSVAIHSLPIKREGLFLTNYLSGLAFIILPNILIFLLTLGCEVAVGYVNIRVLLIWLASVCGMGLFFFSFASFCAQFTGSLLALPVFYLILNILVVGLNLLVPTIIESMIFGYSRAGAETLVFLSPIYYILSNVGSNSANTGLYGDAIIAAYAGAGIVFAAAALLVYRKHCAESAGELVTVGFVKPVFKIGFSFCFGLLLTLLSSSIIGWDSKRSGTWLVLTLLMLVFGAIGYYAADMAVKKSFKVFGKKQRGIYASLGLILVVMLSLKFDVLGIGTYVPAVDELDYVYINEYETSDPEEIKEIIAIQQFIIDNAKVLNQEGTDSSFEYFSFRFAPKDENKNVIRRYYNISLSNEASKQTAEELRKIMDDFVNEPERIIKSNFGDESGTVVSASVGINRYDSVEGLGIYNTYTLYDEDVKELTSAVISDIYAGTLGRNNFYYYDNYTEDELLTAEERYPADVFFSADICFTLTMLNNDIQEGTYKLEVKNKNIYFTVNKDCENTYSMLERYVQ